MILTDTENQILLTPSQSILFEFGEICPTHMKTEFWRFINSSITICFFKKAGGFVFSFSLGEK